MKKYSTFQKKKNTKMTGLTCTNNRHIVPYISKREPIYQLQKSQNVEEVNKIQMNFKPDTLKNVIENNYMINDKKHYILPTKTHYVSR